MSFSAVPVKDETGYTWGGVVAISDIDQLVWAQKIAERSEQRIRVMMERASVGIAVVGFEGGISYANDTLLDWIGYTRAELDRGEVRWDEMTPPAYAQRDRDTLEELRRNKFVVPYEKIYIAKDGTPVPLLIGAASIPVIVGERSR